VRWERGRQGTGYWIFKIFSVWTLHCDCYLIYYPTGSYIPPHKDPAIDGYEHHRINIVLRQADKGGWFWVRQGFGVGTTDRSIVRFRPDIQEHSVDRVLEGSRLVFSFGWLRKAV